MLDVGKERAEERGLTGLEWAVENAEKLSFADASFDAYTIVFGIRNVTDIPAALREAHRVLKRGGRFYCMEFSTSEWPGFAEVYERFRRQGHPAHRQGRRRRRGQLPLSGRNRSAASPTCRRSSAMIGEAGFVRDRGRADARRAGAIHAGWKI